MQTLSEIRALLAEQGVRPKHRLGQNFLHDHNQLRKLIDEAGINPGDIVLEVGPGTGTLTEAILERGASVIACELDEDISAIAERRIEHVLQNKSDRDRFTLIRGDALAKQRALNPEIVEQLAGRRFKLVANLPYQIASPLITTLLIEHPDCAGQYVTIQKEVADRLAAAPSSDAFGPLSVIVQALGEVQRISTLSPSCFWPEPEVTSAMVAIVPKEGARPDFAGAERDFAKFVTELFSKRRKQLGTIVGRSHEAWPELATASITPDLRPEALSIEQMIVLWRRMRSNL